MRDFLGLSDSFTDFENAAGLMAKETSKVDGSFDWVQGQITAFAELNGETIDWGGSVEDVNAKLLQFATSDDDMLAGLALTYLQMEKVKAGTE